MCIKLVCDEVVKNYKPKLAADGKTVLETYCNLALNEVAKVKHYTGFLDTKGRPLLADDICKVLAGEWLKIEGEDAFNLAKGGIWCVAASSSADLRRYGGPKFANASHGHVATVYPKEQMGHSVSWRKYVPWLANVGANNGIKIASLCFPAEPKYYFLPGGQALDIYNALMKNKGGSK